MFQAILLVLLSIVATGAAAEKPLASVSSAGEFLVDGSPVRNSATLFSGSVIAAGQTPVRLWWSAGGFVQLAPGAKVRIEPDGVALDAGSAEVRDSGRLRIITGAIKFSPAEPRSAARIVRVGSEQVQAVASRGAFRIWTGPDVLVARLEPGIALEFRPQTPAPAPPTVTAGCLLRRSGRFVVFNETTKIFYELRGTGFEGEWGNRVQVIGTASAQPASSSDTQVVEVSSVIRIAERGCENLAQQLGAEVPSPAPPGTPQKPLPAPLPPAEGMSAGTKVAIIAGIGGGAAGAAVYMQSRSKDRSR